MKISAQSQSSSTANTLTSHFDRPISHDFQIVDDTLREGEQPPGVVFSPELKLEIVHGLDRLGIKRTIAGFPAVSKEEADTIRRIVDARLKITISALSRLVPSDIEAAADSGAQFIALFAGASDSHLNKLGMSEGDLCKKIEESVARAKTHARQGALASGCGFCLEDASRMPLKRMIKMFSIAVDAGADWLTFSDTVGILTPRSSYHIVKSLKSIFGKPINLHYHNDLGLALANALAGIEAGAAGCGSTINGVGERSGNVCLEELAILLKVKFGLDLGLKHEMLYDLCNLVHRASGTEPGPHKPIAGKWCFTHESGIHVAGILHDQESYQAYPPATIGRYHEIVFGKHSGIKGIKFLSELNGFNISDENLEKILLKVKSLAEKRRALIPDSEVIEWLRWESHN